MIQRYGKLWKRIEQALPWAVETETGEPTFENETLIPTGELLQQGQFSLLFWIRSLIPKGFCLEECIPLLLAPKRLSQSELKP